jgi:serine/threonine protein kinase
MQWVEGPTAEGLLRRYGRIQAPVALSLLRQSLSGLTAMHERKFIHRDLKPSNLLVGSDDVLRIGDLGLAVNLEVSKRLTASGVTMGTPSYMSPEQIESSRIDARSDIYSLGATLYHLITGRAPFEGATPAEVMRKILTSTPPPIRKLVVDLPPPVAALVTRMMNRDPESRFRDAAHTLSNLEPNIKAHALRELPPSRLSSALEVPERPREPVRPPRSEPLRASGSVTIAMPWTVIVTGTRNTAISQAPSRGARFVTTRIAPAISTSAETITQNGRNGIAAGIRAT